MASDLDPHLSAADNSERRQPHGPRGLADVRRLNLRRVLAEIRDRPEVTRKELVSATALNRVTVLDLVADLHERRLIGEQPAPSTGRSGRPATRLSLDDEHLVVAALEINVDRISILCSTLQLRVVHEEFVERAGEGLAPENVVGLAADCVNRARYALAKEGRELVRVSVGVPAFIDHRSGTVLTALSFGWNDVPVVELLQQATGGELEFTLDRLANLAIREERAAEGLASASGLVVLYGDMGVGGAFQKGGVILRGDSGSGAEFGHITVDSEGPRCYCGNRGCLEMYVGIRPLATELGILEDGESGVAQQVLALLEADDSEARSAARAQASWLARALWTLQTIFDPRTLILGGHLSVLGRAMSPLLEEELSAHQGGRRIDLRFSRTGADSVLSGGVRAARDDLLEAPWSV